MSDSSIIGQLYQRKMFRIGAGYLAVAWLLWQVVANTCPTFECSNDFSKTIFWLLLAGLPITLAVAWINWKTAIIVGVAFIAGAGVAVMVTGSQSIPVVPVPIAEEAESEGVLPNSVAVLLCDNLSPDENDAYFAAGIHEEILNQLVKLSALNVIARTSVLQYADNPPPIPQIAEELNVGSVLECSVRYAGTSILVTAQLIDPLTNSHLWSETYPGDIGDLAGVFAMQADIAMNIANAIGAEFSQEEQQSIATVPTDSPAAYALYLRAFSRPGETLLNVQDLKAAIEIDPNFALAYEQLAWVSASGLVFSLQVPEAEYVRDVISNANIALELNPNSGLAHASLAVIDGINWSWDEALRRTELAYQLNPNKVGVVFLYIKLTRDAGEYQKSFDAFEQWIKLEPNDETLYTQLAITYRYAKRYDAAAVAAKRSIEANPAIGNTYLHLAFAEIAGGHREEATANIQTAEQLFGGNFTQVFRISQMALAYSLVGRNEDAERMLELLEELEREGTAVGEAIWAQAQIALGNYDLALELLEVAMDSQSAVNYTTLIEIKANSWSIAELDTPRFTEVLSELWLIE